MTKNIFFISIPLLLIIVMGLSGCSTINPSPTLVPSPQPLPSIAQAPTSTETYPLTAEDTIMAALTFYRQSGYDALKATWLTEAYAQQMSYTDFLAGTVNNMPTSPAALMGWEIQKMESETAIPGSVKAFVKTTYQGGAMQCRWIFLEPPSATGNHWRISNSNITPCDGENVSLTNTSTAAAKSGFASPNAWYPCGNNAPASAIRIGSVVYVNPVPPLSVRIWQSLGEGAELMDWLNPGDVVAISGGPSCYSERVYWQVHFKNFLLTNDVTSFEEYDGWIAEMESASNYLLLPCSPSGPCGGGFTPERTRRNMQDPEWLTKSAK